METLCGASSRHRALFLEMSPKLFPKLKRHMLLSLYFFIQKAAKQGYSWAYQLECALEGLPVVTREVGNSPC